MKQPLLDQLRQATDASLHQDIFRLSSFLEQHLSEITRRSGENYFQHGCEVALTLQETDAEPDLLLAAMAHDLLIHPEGKNLLKQSPLTEAQRELVSGMHALRRLHIDEKTNDLDLALKTFTKDDRLVLMRMAHRLNDIRHLDRFEPQLKREIARESLHMYTAIAGRLGLHRWRREMEDLCFQLLHPKRFQHLEQLSQEYFQLDELCIRHTQKYLEQRFQEAKLKVRVESRRKSLYSSYRKMVLKNRRYEELLDRIAMRLIVPKREQCYLALAIVHQWMHPIPGKLKDYIGAPKENGYRSIHTVVYPLPGVSELPIEIQIRTEEMDRECEWGIAAHSRYKLTNYVFHKPQARVNIFQNLEHLRSQVRSPKQFEQALRTYFRDDHLVIFDSSDNLFHLQKPANAIDAALLLNQNKARRLKKIFINGKEADLDTPLENGDVIKVELGKGTLFQKGWKKSCRHSASVDLINQWIS